MTTKAVADWLIATVESDLSVTDCKKGWPAFDRPNVAAGAYIDWNTTSPMYGERVSASIDRWETQFDLLVVTANEVALWAMLDLMETMAETRTAATISSKGTRIRFAAIERAENPFNNNALRYAAATTIQFVR